MNITISPRRIIRILILVVVLLTFAGLAAQILEVIWGNEGILQLTWIFNVVFEPSIPTWYSSFALLLCSVLLAAIAATKKRHGDRYALHWGVLSVIFLLLSVDEVAGIHETTTDVGRYLVDSFAEFVPSVLVFYFRVAAEAVFVLVFLLWYLRFLTHLPRKTLFLFLGAGTLFVAGVLGLEAVELWLLSRLDEDGGVTTWEDIPKPKHVPFDTQLWLAVQRTIEEALEMSSILIFIYALLSYASSYVNEMSVQIRSEDQ